MEALKELGNDANDESIQKALKFILRTQNLAGQGNDTEHAKKVGRRWILLHTGCWRIQPSWRGTTAGGLRSYGVDDLCWPEKA